MTMQRREFLKAAAAAGATTALAGCASMGRRTVGRQGGRGRRRLRRRHGGEVHSHVERGTRRRHARRDESARSSRARCRNLVLGGSKTLADITVQLRRPRAQPRRRVVRDTATAVDPDKQHRAARERQRRCRTTGSCSRRASTSCTTSVPGLNNAAGAGSDPARVEGRSADGGAAPAARSDAATAACTRYRSRSRPIAARRDPTSARARSRGTSSGRSRSSKVLILDGNPDVTSKAGLFKRPGRRSTRASSSTGRTTC